MTDWLTEATEVATTVARTTHKKFHTYFDMADIKQECMVWIIRRQEKVQEWLEGDVESEQYKSGVRHLAKTLGRYADRYARSRKAQMLGYELRDEFFYTPEFLSEVLPHVWGEIAETRDTTKPKVSGGGNPAEGGNYIVSVIDIRKGLAQLDPHDRTLLNLRFDRSMVLSEIAEYLGISTTTADRKIKGALRRLSNFLGGESPYERKSGE